jgi:hypothetical protein
VRRKDTDAEKREKGQDADKLMNDETALAQIGRDL